MKRIALAMLLMCGVAEAGEGTAALDAAQQAIDDVDYETARDLTGKAIAGGGLELDELVRAHRLAGEVAAALGDDKAAREHFVRWVLLEPRAALRAGMSPKIVEPFTVAKGEAERLGGFSLDVQVARETDRVKVVLTATDPLKMIAGMKLRLGDASEVSVTGARAVLPTGNAQSVEIAVVVVDQQGNVLTRLSFAGAAGGDDDGAVVEPTPAGPRTTVRHSIPAPLRWPVWTGVAVIAAGAGGYFVYRVGQAEDELAALNASSSAHTFDEAIAIQERGDRDAMIANVAFGVAGAAAVAAVLTFVLDEERVEVLPAPGGSVGATASLRF